MNGFWKALMGLICVSIDRAIARKISSGILTLALMAVVLLLTAGSASAETQITTCTELQDMKNDLSEDYYLANDIDCSCTKTWNGGAGFEPVGTFTNGFTGTFDGQGHTITNLFINRPATGYVGLFGYTGSESELKNVSLGNISISGHIDVGGLVGHNEYGTISNSSSTGSVSSSDNKVGGLVGYNKGIISNSYSTSNVDSNSSNQIGGLVGINEETINNSYSTGSVSGNTFIGGLVGNNFGTINNSYSTGNVSGNSCTGGLVGLNYEGTISNSYWDTETSGQSTSDGGEGRTTAQMKQQATFVNWYFDDIWAIDEDVTYPVHQWQLCLGPAKPFVVSGHVNHSSGPPLNGPTVTITNTRTGKVFTAETNESSSYYRVITSSWKVTACDMLHFNATNDNSTVFDHCVTRDEINNGGFMQDIVIDNLCTGEIGCVNSTGYVYQCGETVMESCTFNGDMDCPATENGLVVGADNIVIDGAGHLLNGSVEIAICNLATHSGIVNALSDNVVVKDLEIQNFCSGIEIGDYGMVSIDVVINMEVTGCKIHDCGRLDAYGNGIVMWGPTYCNIIKNEIYNISGFNEGSCTDGGNGIFMDGRSMGAHGNGDDNTINCNRIYNVTKSGIFLRKGCMHNNMSYNHITGCDEGGIIPMCTQSNNNTYEYNNLLENVQCGFSTGGKHNNIRYNTANNNGYYGIYTGSIGNSITNNSACENGYDDIGYSMGYSTGSSNTCGSGPAGCCDWNCNNLVPVYFDFDNDGHYSNTPENCTCSNILGVGSCCNPGLFNSSHATMLNASGIFWLVPGDDPNDCDPSIPDAKPDLTITEKSEEWISQEDRTYNITYTVKNIGNAEANESTTSIRIDVSEVVTDPVELLAPQATHIAELGPFTMSDGSDTIRVCADNESVVIESSEDNNCKENIFKFHGKPDLVISKKYEEWVASNETYNTYTITYTIENIGTGTANESITSILIDGIEAATDPVGTLYEGESYTSTIGSFTMTGENNTIIIYADNESAVDESDEDNNCIENTFDYSEIGCVAEDSTLFRCGNIITKSCIFNGDTICASGSGLIIGTDGITINGDDHRITGIVIPDDCNDMGSESSPCTISGIYNSGFDSIKIKNLEIKGFCTGIALTGVYNITINNCIIHDNGFNTGNMATHGIHACNIANGAPDDPALTITDNDIYNNEGTGADCGAGGNGIFIFAGSGDKHEYCNISHNKLHHNAKSGFWTKMMLTRSEITYNEIWGNGYGTGITDDQRGGIVLRCAMSNENLIAYNDVYINDVDGIFIGGSNNTIEYNNVTNNTDDGIDMGRGDGSYNNELYENSVCENWDNDIITFGAESNTIGENNTCDSTNNYDDTGATGCTFICGGNIVEFSAEPTKGASPLTVSFTDEARPEENKESWSWDFDGDGIEDNTTQNPLNTHTTAVSYSYYNVSLIVNWSGAGSASETKTEYIRVWRPDAAPNADFYCEPGVGDHTIPVTFTDTSLGEITSWRWDFGDGNTSDEQNPVHTYSTNGIYNISLNVTGPGGLSLDTKFYCIRIGTEGAPKRPLIDAHFFADKRTGSAPFTVQFTDMSRSQGDIVSWKWDFGDRNTSDEQNPQHTYDSLGIYNVSLETTLNTGAVTNETKIDYITVSTTAPTPFVISGRVNCTNGDPVNDPDVTVVNLNSSEILPVETYAASNYYRIVVTSSDNVSTGNVLHFNVTGSSNPIDFNHTITADEIETGGFARNIAVDCGFSGICGDVTCNGVVDTGDVILLSNYVGYYPGMPQYALNSTQIWAGDVTGNDVIDTGDVILSSNYVGYSGYELNCT